MRGRVRLQAARLFRVGVFEQCLPIGIPDDLRERRGEVLLDPFEDLGEPIAFILADVEEHEVQELSYAIPVRD
jgi:hypothetical protein